MAIDDVADLIEKVDFLMGAVSEDVGGPQKEQAVEQALSELAMVLPNTDDFQCHWIIERTRRHILYILAIEFAKKFRYKQIRLNERFNHFFKLIGKMDEDFAKAVEDNPGSFPLGSVSWMSEFLPAGFLYDQFGRDLTYL